MTDKCASCSRSFKSAKHLEVHVKDACGAPIRARTCVVCDKEFTAVSGLRQHLTTESHKSRLKATSSRASTPTRAHAHDQQQAPLQAPTSRDKTIATSKYKTNFVEPTTTSVFAISFRNFVNQSIEEQVFSFERAISGASRTDKGSAPAFFGTQKVKSSHEYALVLKQCLMTTLASLREPTGEPAFALQETVSAASRENSAFTTPRPQFKGREGFLFPSSTFLASGHRLSLLFHCSDFLVQSPSLSKRCQVYPSLHTHTHTHTHTHVHGTHTLHGTHTHTHTHTHTRRSSSNFWSSFNSYLTLCLKA